MHEHAGHRARRPLRVSGPAQWIRRPLGGTPDRAIFSAPRDELMRADFSVELGRDDAALELPWSSADPALRFYDLKKHPELLQQIPEAVAYPELGAFLCADQCRRVSPG